MQYAKFGRLYGTAFISLSSAALPALCLLACFDFNERQPIKVRNINVNNF